MLTVVLKLFHLIRPDLAIFGQKDAQQLACIQRMVLDLNVGVEIVAGPIIREPDGLATSSRNVYLSPAERSLALSLSTALEKAATQTTVPAARAAAYETLDRAADDPAFELDYAAIVQPATFAEVPDDHTGPALFVVAAQVGRTRLIDNAALTLRLRRMDLDQAADELYAVSPDDFMARRTALVGEARAAGDRALAKQIGQLRKPTRSAWLVNLLAREEGSRITELLELGAALQRAQQRMEGDELRRLSKERRRLIDALARRRGRPRPRPGLRSRRRGDAGGQPDPAGRPQRPANSRPGRRRPGAPGGELRRFRPGGSGVRARRVDADGRAEGRTPAADERPPRDEKPARGGRGRQPRGPRPPRPRRTAAESPRQQRPKPTSSPIGSSRCAPNCGAEENREREAREEARAARKRLTELTRVAAAAEDDARAAEGRASRPPFDKLRAHRRSSGLISATRWSSSADPRRAAGNTMPAVSSTRPDISSASPFADQGGVTAWASADRVPTTSSR